MIRMRNSRGAAANSAQASTRVAATEGMSSPTPSEVAAAPHATPATVTPTAVQDVATATNQDQPPQIAWDTETLSAATSDRLKQLVRLPREHAGKEEQLVVELATEDVAAGSLRPTDLQESYRDEAIAIFTRPPDAKSVKVTGRSPLCAELSSLAKPLKDVSNYQLAVKVVRVNIEPTSATTMALFQASGQTSQGFLQQDATLHCKWSLDGPGKPPLLTEIESETFRETITRPQTGTLFADCTEAALGDNACFREDIVYGSLHWRKQLPKRFNPSELGYHGIAVGDVNGDGLDDIYLCSPAGLPNRLFTQNTDGTVTDMAAEAGVDWLDGSRAVLLVDLDNDDDQDLVLVTKTHTMFMSNDGQGRFELRNALPAPRMRTSISAVDYDGDSDLDIYMCRYGLYMVAEVDPANFSDAQFALGIPNPVFDANNGDPNSLLRNDGEFQFTDVTVETGMDEKNRRYSFAAAWEDYDNDGDQDVYIANDFGRNNLYRNDDGIFKEVATEAGVEDLGAGMGVTWGDFNNDGLMDLYVSNMFSSAGNRIGLQPDYQDYLVSTKGDQRGNEEMQNAKRAMKGNTLFQNLGDGTFRDVTDQADVSMALWSWGGMFVDINNDTRQDLVIPNGNLTNDDTKDL